MHLFVLRNHGDDVAGAGFDAGPAAHAAVAVHLGDAVDHVNGVEFAGLDAGAEAHAAERTGLRSPSGDDGSTLAVGNSQVHAVFGRFGGRPLTAHEGDFGRSFAGNDAHNGGNFFCDLGAAHDAEIEGARSGGAGFGVVVASGITASAAVGAGKNGTDPRLSRIDGSGEFFGGEAQKASEEDAQASQNDYGKENSVHRESPT